MIMYSFTDDFECSDDSYQLITPEKYPGDIKRIVSSCDGCHTLCKGFYFINVIFRTVYILPIYPLCYKIKGNSKIYCLIDDNDKRYGLCVNDKLVDRIKDMNKIELSKIK